MLRSTFAVMTLLSAAALTGCVGGPQCYDCSGNRYVGQIHAGPAQSMRAFRRSMTCGAGCGETYFGEWRSTPPDCCDPCPPEFSGGGYVDCGGCGQCNHCAGFGVRPLLAVGLAVQAVYGKRFCGDCGYAWSDCGCGPAACGGCGSCGDCAGGAIIEGGVPAGDCATGDCSASNTPSMQTPVQRARQQALARRQMMARPQTNQPQTAASRPDAASEKFVRQAQRIPRGLPSIRR